MALFSNSKTFNKKYVIIIAIISSGYRKEEKILKDKNTVDESVYLDRPWREYGFVNFKNCYLDSHINKERFSIWEGTNRHINCRFYEENSSGPGG